MTTVDDKLKQIVGENDIDASPKTVGGYFEGEVEAPGLLKMEKLRVLRRRMVIFTGQTLS